MNTCFRVFLQRLRIFDRLPIQTSFFSHLPARSVLQALRWLVFVTVFFVILFGYRFGHLYDALPALIVIALYSLANIIFARSISRSFESPGWTSKLFLADLAVIAVALFSLLGLDSEFYLVCSLIVYFSVISKSARNALPIAALGSVLYSVLLFSHYPSLDIFDSQILIRIPFFFILSLFTGYLSEQEEGDRKKIAEMARTQTVLNIRIDEVAEELKQKQEELLQSEKLASMGHRAGVLAHELKNILTLVLGHVVMLMEDVEDKNPRWTSLKAIEKAVLHSNNLLYDLLVFSRKPKKSPPIDVRAAVHEAFDLMRVGSNACPVKIVRELQETPKVAIGKGEIEQVVLNLMKNALDAMGDHGTLTVRLFHEIGNGSSWVMLEVQDTGAGIPEEVRKRVFDPFFTTKDAGKGTGLGLSIVRDIIENHGGSIRFESNISQGTTFFVRIPVE